MNIVMYKDILTKNKLPSAQQLSLGCHFVFQQDNDPEHTSKTIKA